MLRPRKQRHLSRHATQAIAWGRRCLTIGASDTAGTALLAGLIAALLATGTAGLALLNAIQFGPPVGAILTFGPYAQPGPVWHIDALRRADQRHCVLQPAVMAAAPGSMVVEARSADGRSFQVHWAGGATSTSGSDCGSAVDLTIGLTAIQTLVNADSMGQPHWHFVPS